MLVSLRWLKDYVEIDLPAGELAERLTMAGLEIDAIQETSPDFLGVVVAQIQSLRSHPEADRLFLCEVTDGDAAVPIVCGATNIRVGDKVPLAKAGARLPGGFVIEASRIRGEASEGMLCSEEELGIGSDASGIMILDAALPLGTDLGMALDLHETILDIGVTPNRSDCLSLLGIAREIGALTGRKACLPAVRLDESGQDIHSFTSVTIQDADLCPRYTARFITDLKVKPSPFWLRRRLEAVGLRAINNIVDVTNFVMLEMGQPLHAFDFPSLEGSRIVVRRANEGESFVSLDGKERSLRSDVLMICDGVKPVAIGGIMGGLHSEVRGDTITVLLESAYFHPPSIRKSSRWLGMATDAAFRFERGVDPAGVVRALDRAAHLIAELGEGRICRNRIDTYPRFLPDPQPIPLRLKRIETLLGNALPSEQVVEILERLGMTVSTVDTETLSVMPPSYRLDLSREVDLIEEVARMHGYDQVPVTMPNVPLTPAEPNPKIILEDKIRRILTGYGFVETIHYSFTHPAFARALLLPEGDPRCRKVVIRNPLSDEWSVMRTNMVYHLLETLRKNQSVSIENVKIFEIGKIFTEQGSDVLPLEGSRLGCLLAGARHEPLWSAKDATVDYFDLKGFLEGLGSGLHLAALDYSTDDLPAFLHPRRASWIVCDRKRIGFLGEVHPGVMVQWDLRGRSFVAELDVEGILSCMRPLSAARELAKFPFSTRDIALVLPQEMEAGGLIKTIHQMGEELLENVQIFDVYSGPNLPVGKKSLGIRLSYRSSQKTLTDEEVSQVHGRIVRQLVEVSGAIIRGEEA